MDKGYSPDEVADLLEVCPRTVKNWLAQFQAGPGWRSLCSLGLPRRPRRISLLVKSTNSKQEVAPPDASSVRLTPAIGSRKPSVEGSPRAACVNCSRGWACSFHKAAAFLFKADQEKQKEFVEDYEQDKQKVASDGWRRYLLDGVHPLYGLEVVFYCWLLAGQRFEVGVGGGRKRLNVLGAYCPDDQEYLDRRYTDKNLNAQSVIELFTLMMAKHPDTKHFRIYLDNARYQHAKILMAWIAETKKTTEA